MKISVLIPTYRRHHDLNRCLDALKLQELAADEVIVMVRDSDLETWKFLEEKSDLELPLQIIKVNEPGQVNALNQGLLAATGDIVSITDDDAAPHSDWLKRIKEVFQDNEKVGGVGGRDWVYHDGQLREYAVNLEEDLIVGKVQWFGRVIGNHHLGYGKARKVDILKGVNMSYRASAISGLRFDTRLLGSGAEIHNDMNFSLQLRRREWQLIYDPAIAVDHHEGQRFSENQRHLSRCARAAYEYSFNEAFTLLSYLSPLQKIIFLFWTLCVGTKDSPGFVQDLRLLSVEGLSVWRKSIFSKLGKLQGISFFLRTRMQNLISQIS